MYAPTHVRLLISVLPPVALIGTTAARAEPPSKQGTTFQRVAQEEPGEPVPPPPQPAPPAPAPAPVPAAPPTYAPAPPPGQAPVPMGPAYVAAPTRPPAGVGLLITGTIFLGVGVVNLIAAPLCKTDAISHNPDVQNVCFYASLGVGIGSLAAGIPLTVVGARRRRAYNEWRRSHPMAARLLEGLQLRTGHDLTGLAFGGTY